MQTKEEAQAVSEQLKDLLLQLAITHEIAIQKLDGTELQRQQAEFIDGTIERVHKEILPRYGNQKVLQYGEGRSMRNFEFEHQRLWNRALALYSDDWKTSAPQIEQFLKDPSNASLVNELQSGLRKQMQTLTVPLLDKHATPGEDFYLFIFELGRVVKLASNMHTQAECRRGSSGLFCHSGWRCF